ncbi:uncharacterized protein LOC144887128 [Branchiostoma floridae x Branchiostoma japonicum]
MAVKGIILLLDLYFLLCRADEGINFTVSVLENAKIGTGVVSLPKMLGEEKAELPCVMLDGDRYGRFSVSTNCTVVVARPLDWSVQSEYLLKVRVGGLQDPGHHVVSIKLNVRNVLGYPPVYNETCETPVNLTGNRSNEFQFSISLSAEAETAAGDVVSYETTISKPLERWKMDDNSKLVITTDNNCQSRDNGRYKCQASDANGNVFNATIVFDIAKCPPNRKGEFCDEACDCLQGATCDWRNGCVCPPGWTGTRCQATCPNGKFGERCLKTCRCRNDASCSPSDGKCTCTAGWYGLWCDVPCPRYRHGLGCQLTCTCKNNATCDNVDGSCTCMAPWTGKNCDEKQAEPLLESLVPIGSMIVLAGCVATIIMLYKRKQVCGREPDRDGETEALLQLEQVESDLAQAVRPGWLRRWGTTSRHLTLGQLIGMGRFGHVIRARFKTSAGDVTVAAKEVRTRDGPCYRSFFREAAILVAVHEDRHHDNLRSNIIQLLALVNESTKKYIIMEYASKGCLLRLLQQTRRQNGPHAQPLPYTSNVRYAVHIARALQELQRLALTHGDVAARNVLITADDVAKLADFGQARDVYTTVQHVPNDKRGSEPANRDTNNAGNEVLPLNWMSVESLETGEYTCQSDVWSFGVLLWEIATLGQEPRYDGNNQATCHQLARTLRRGIRLRRPPDCSGEMYDVMMSCWRESPPERPVPNVLETKLMQMCHTMITEKETTV